MQVSADNIVVSALKRGEDDDGTILRAYEAAGQATAVVIECSLLEATLELEFRPHEVKTVKIGDDGEVKETDLLEMSGQGNGENLA